MLLSLLFLVIFFATLIQADKSLVFNRVRFTEDADKRSSVRFHGYSPDLVLIHAILRFSSPINELHNALLIDQSSLLKYKKILHESNTKITITTRSVKKILSYLTLAESLSDSDANKDGVNDKLYELVRSATKFGIGFTSAISYDAILLLDEYSSIWNEYNVMVFTRSMLTFTHTLDGALSQVGDQQVEQYKNGVARIRCDPSFISDQCLAISTSGGIEANGVVYPTYRVLIDLDSPINIVPIDLYLSLLNSNQSNGASLTLRIDENTTLYLSGKYTYEMQQTNIIVLGIDIVHNFPRVEYSVMTKTYQLWFYESERDEVVALQRNVKIGFSFLMMLLLVCLFRFATSYNYEVLQYMIKFGEHAKTTHYFGYRQIIYELLALIVSLVVIIVSYAVTDEPSSLATPYQTRKTIFTVSLLVDSLLCLYFTFAYRAPLIASYKHLRTYFTSYWKDSNNGLGHSINGGCYSNKKKVVLSQLLLQSTSCTEEKKTKTKPMPCDAIFADIADRKMAELINKEVQGVYHDAVIKQSVPLTLTHNMLFISIVLHGLQLLFNFYTELNPIYILLILVLSLTFLYYQVKYICMGIFYLALFYPGRQRRKNNWIRVALVVRALFLVLEVCLSYECLYFAYFDTINSTYARSIGDTYILCLIAIIALVAVLMVTTQYDKHVDTIIEDAIEEGLSRRTKKNKPGPFIYLPLISLDHHTD